MRIHCVIFALILVLLPLSVLSDRPSNSHLKIWTESDSLFVLHKHRARAGDVFESITRIIDKQTGYILTEIETTPFTALLPVEDGQYFAGLSYFQASSYPHGYNFALFSAQGKFIVKAFVLSGSGHCKKPNQSVSQYVHWYNENDPNVRLRREGNEIIEILVDSYYANDEPCRFVPGDHSVRLELE